MGFKVNCYAAKDKSGVVEPYVIERREVGDIDVLIRIKYCGICHSDLHTLKGEWGGTQYPACTGHEIVGEVKKVGASVKKFKPGDIVGVGCMVDSCQKCDKCKEGWEQYCDSLTLTYNSPLPDGSHTFGGYSTHIVVREEFVVSIPPNVDLAATAPLLCAGCTTYTPLRLLDCKPGKIVGILGVGGLGHVGVKIAKAMGAEVVAITRQKSKEAEVLRMGASRILVSTDPEQMKAAVKSMDIILDTISAQHDLGEMLNLLKSGGTMVALGVPNDPVKLDLGTLVVPGRTLLGSCIAGIPWTQDMLDFCAKHNITADIELVSADYINKAVERLQVSDVRYRFVIDIENTLPLAQ